MIDLIGKKFGKLTVVSRAKNIDGRCAWLCQCECGNNVIVSSSNLRRGGTKSCGCIRRENLTGQKFGRLTAICFVRADKQKTGSTKSLWRWKCDCGNEIEVYAERVKSGNTKSCGCYEKEIASKISKTHGMSKTRIYHIYIGMKNRCNNQNTKIYKNYGGRGINICNEWNSESGFENFYSWSIKNGYSDELTIDRIDNNGDYCPENCRWTTNKEQQRNKRNNTIIVYENKSYVLSELAEKTGINGTTLQSRIKSGMSIEEAVNYKKKEIIIALNGKENTIREWSRITGIPYNTIYARCRKGLEPKDILHIGKL